MKASKFQLITGIIAFLGFVGGIVLGGKMEELSGEFSATLMFEGWIAVALYCIPLIGICNILENQEEIISLLYRNNNKIDSYVKGESSEINKSEDKGNDASRMWTCKGCGEVNRGDKRICQACGRDK